LFTKKKEAKKKVVIVIALLSKRERGKSKGRRGEETQRIFSLRLCLSASLREEFI